ncbi:proline-rich protein 2-like [Antechinus flavipes]|uniref:proline-rich protein 2-like n=1 Tax=Antechinus flavipes TaxID=38775 RepID=UPI0022368023|nr:proline-rich protein 2-like [Antechinus flavipes]
MSLATPAPDPNSAAGTCRDPHRRGPPACRPLEGPAAPPARARRASAERRPSHEGRPVHARRGRRLRRRTKPGFRSHRRGGREERRPAGGCPGPGLLPYTLAGGSAGGGPGRELICQTGTHTENPALPEELCSRPKAPAAHPPRSDRPPRPPMEPRPLGPPASAWGGSQGLARGRGLSHLGGLRARAGVCPSAPGGALPLATAARPGKGEHGSGGLRGCPPTWEQALEISGPAQRQEAKGQEPVWRRALPGGDAEGGPRDRPPPPPSPGPPLTSRFQAAGAHGHGLRGVGGSEAEEAAGAAGRWCSGARPGRAA